MFVMKSAEGLINYGLPAHRYESLTVAASVILGLDAEFFVLPGFLLASFENSETGGYVSKTIVCFGDLNVGKLEKVHDVYWRVCYDQISAVDGTHEIDAILNDGPEYGTFVQTVVYFLQGALLSVLAFGGAFLDMILAGAFSAAIGLTAQRVTRIYWLTPFK
jgi:uncharacterized membrane protein YjjP (DUF1212 family)